MDKEITFCSKCFMPLEILYKRTLLILKKKASLTNQRRLTLIFFSNSELCDKASTKIPMFVATFDYGLFPHGKSIMVFQKSYIRNKHMQFYD